MKKKVGKTEEELRSKIYISKISAVIANVLSFFSWVGIGASAVYGFIKHNIWVFVPIVLLFAFILIVRYIRRHKTKIISLVMNWFSPSMPYMIKEQKVTYKYEKNNTCNLRVEYLVKALQVDVDRINIRFNWSGESKDNKIQPEAVKDKSIKNNFTRALNPIGGEFGYAFYELYASKKYNKDDEFPLAYEIKDMRITDKEPSPHLLVSVTAVTDNLEMEVSLPSYIYPENVKAKEFLNSTDFYPWQTQKIEPEKDGDNWILRYSPSYPIYGGKYLIEWTPSNLSKENVD